MVRARSNPEEPKFAVDLASYPAFRVALLEFREFTRKTTGANVSPDINGQIASTDDATRKAGFKQVADNLAPLLLAAHMWRIDSEAANYAEQVLRNLTPCLDWVTRVLNLPREPFPAVRFGTKIQGDDDKMIPATAENVPPCWSPRGKTKSTRELFQRSAAELYAAAMSNYVLELLENIDLDSADMVKSQLSRNPELAANPDRLSQVYTAAVLGRKRDVAAALELFLRVARERTTAQENADKEEARQIMALAETTSRARDAAWRKIDAMTRPMSAEEQKQRATEKFLKTRAAQEETARKQQEVAELMRIGSAPPGITTTKPNPRGGMR